jgi:hypothetical protein
MKHARFRLGCVLVVIALVALTGNLAQAQGVATSTLSGVVVDSSGGVMPGADVQVKNAATGETYTAVSLANGTFSVPAIQPGTYTITIALMGFKTAVLNNIVVNAAAPANVGKVVLEIGKLEETVVVQAATEIVQTQSTAVATTINSKQISNLPLPGRAAFDFVTLLPGVATSSGTRNAMVNGLPTSLVNITLDGMNIQDNYAKSWDGMFTRVSPRLDAVEEVSVSTASQGASDAGQGGVQIKFSTRQGTNDFKGSLYYYMRRDWMNTNTYWNINRYFQPKPVEAQYQPGGRIGGPIIIPGLYDGHDKAFFFVNYEWISTPGTLTSTRTIMTPDSMNGLFTKANGQKVQLTGPNGLAAQNGQVSAIDPQVAALLAKIWSSAQTGTMQPSTDGLIQQFSWQQPTKGNTKYPTVRIDYNLTSRHRLTGSVTYNHLISDPDTTNSYQRVFPDFPVHGLQDSKRYTTQVSLRSTLTKNMVNELRVGATGGATQFSPDLSPDMFDYTGGYSFAISAFRGISNPNPLTAFSAREGATRVIDDNVNWLKGAHSIGFGATYTRALVWLKNQTYVPTLTFNMTSSGDPADAMFNANFSGNDLTYARQLYGVLTGRISSIGRNARIDESGQNYVILGQSMQKGIQPTIGSYLQDSWRMKPNLTVNAGLRWEVALPFYAENNSYSTASIEDIFGLTGPGSDFVAGSTVTNLGNLFKPGVQQGQAQNCSTTYVCYDLLEKGKQAYNTDWNNLAPSIGIAWTVGSETGMLRKILGKPGDFVVRAGYSAAYSRQGMSDYTGVYGANPGVSIDATRNQANGNLGTVPLLVSTGDLGAPTNIPATRTYPMSVPSATSSVNIYDANIKVPRSDSFTVGVQRALSRTMAVEARFIHTGSKGAWTIGQWSPYNYNEINIVENNFVSEFRLAQANLQANMTAINPATGKVYGQTFAYTGAPGTNPLPTFLAYLNGSAAASDTSKYSGSNWTSSTLIATMYPLNPNPRTTASTLATNATYKLNAANAGLARNWFLANPDIGNANVVTNGPDTRYNGVQFELRRRFAQGLQASANYSYGKAYQTTFYGFHKPMVDIEQNYTSIYSNGGGNAAGNIRHVFAGTWVYELPFGQGKAFGGNVSRNVQRIIGNWSFMGTARFQSGRMVDFGNVRMVNMTPDDVRNMFQLRRTYDTVTAAGGVVNNRTRVWNLPQDVIDNTIKAFSVGVSGYTAGTPTGRYFAPANGPDCVETTSGYGDCGIRSLIVTGPAVIRLDMSFGKQIFITSRVNFEFQAQVFNVLNRTNFNPNPYLGTTLDSYEVTGSVDSARTMQLALRINF